MGTSRPGPEGRAAPDALRAAEGAQGRKAPARRAALRACALVALAAISLAACSSERERPPWPSPFAGPSADGSIGFDALHDGPPDPDASGLCGNELFAAIKDVPNVYVLLDKSGSMLVQATETETRDEVARAALGAMVQTLGPRIRVGAALFPDPDAQECAAGKEVFPATQGDPVTGQPGPVTQAFLAAIDALPAGGTPTAETVNAVAPKLLSLEGTTIAVLVTDGAPNCHLEASCGAGGCIPYLEGKCASNCCADGAEYGPWACLDDQRTLDALAKVHAAGVDVYVVGFAVPAAFYDVLEAMAQAGGTARPQHPYFYNASDLAGLKEQLSAIASVVVTCEFVLDAPPPDPKMTNVYLDYELVPFDPTDGWTWTSATGVVLHGEACARVKAGKVAKVQIASGCPTAEPK